MLLSGQTGRPTTRTFECWVCLIFRGRDSEMLIVFGDPNHVPSFDLLKKGGGWLSLMAKTDRPGSFTEISELCDTVDRYKVPPPRYCTDYVLVSPI